MRRRVRSQQFRTVVAESDSILCFYHKGEFYASRLGEVEVKASPAVTAALSQHTEALGESEVLDTPEERAKITEIGLLLVDGKAPAKKKLDALLKRTGGRG